MKKLFRALSLCLTLALCVSGSTAALAEAPAATPAPQDERVITDVRRLGDQIRDVVGCAASTGGPYEFERAAQWGAGAAAPPPRRLNHQHRRALRLCTGRP